MVTADTLVLATDDPHAFPIDTIYSYHYELDNELLAIQRVIDARAAQALYRLDLMVDRMHREAGIRWLRWMVGLGPAHRPPVRSYDEQKRLYDRWTARHPVAVPGSRHHGSDWFWSGSLELSEDDFDNAGRHRSDFS